MPAPWAGKPGLVAAGPPSGCVVACSDANWAWQSLFVLLRSLRLDPAGQLDHHLYLTGAVDPRVLALIPPRVTLHTIDRLPEYFTRAATDRISAATVMRFQALQDLGARYDRVIYLDGDVFQAWGSLADLLAVDLGGRAVAAVRDRLQWFQDWKQPKYLAALAALAGTKTLAYLNAGVLLCDGAQVGALCQRALGILRDHPDLCRYGDQSALNTALAGHWAELSPGWNWQMSPASFTLTESRRPRLIHFTGQIKPWTDAHRLMPPAAFDAMQDWLSAQALRDLLPDTAPSHYDAPRMERRRAKLLSRLTDAPLTRQAEIGAYLDRSDFADGQAGITAYG